MLKQEIIKLINLKQEGLYWDFKREWYSKEKKQDLLHDIICMSNNLSNRNAYIIIGVDEENDYGLVSTVDDKNRRTTQNIVDFLREKQFAGENRPIVSVETIIVHKNEIDVIVIHNSNKTPFYLIKDVGNVKANYIYTRTMDSNTPKNKSADISDVEVLWRKRFGLLLPPIEKFNIYLKNRNLWDQSTYYISSEKYFYIYAPEFVIESKRVSNRKDYEFYFFNQTDITPSWYLINLYYYQTIMFSINGVSLDGGRYFTPEPKYDGISLNRNGRWNITFLYFVKDSIEYNIHEFYYQTRIDDERIAHDKFLECVLIFDSVDEKEQFKIFANSKWLKKQEYEKDIFIPRFEKIEGYNDNKFKEDYINSQILQKMLVEFRSKNSNNKS